MRNIKTFLKNPFSTNKKPDVSLVNFEPSLDVSSQETVTNMNDWGAQQAMKHRGSTEGLISSLTRVQRGHIVEAGSEQNKQNEAKKQYYDQINQNEKDIASKYSSIEEIEENKIPFENNKIQDKREDINKLELDMSSSIISSNYSAVNNYFLLALVVLIGIYLLMFYASAINAALFTNMGDKLQGVTSDNLDALFVSIFDIEVFTVWTAKSIFIYIAAVLFIGIGYLPHTTNNVFKKVLFYLFPLVVDAMLAYKIEVNIYESKVMTGLADPDMPWFNHMLSVNFWLVLAFGYVAYIVWGQLWEAWTEEREKKNAGRMSYIQIQNLKKNIDSHEAQIMKYKTEVNNLKSDIDSLNKDIERLKNEMNYVVYSRQDLSRKLNTFFDGWLIFLSTDSQLINNIPASKSTFQEYISNLNLA